MSQSLRRPSGTTTMEFGDVYQSGSITLSAATTETSLTIINASEWREGLVLINTTAIAGTSPSLVITIYNQDRTAARYSISTSTITATGKTRVTLPAPIGSTIEVTYSLTGTGPSATFTVEVEFKT